MCMWWWAFRASGGKREGEGDGIRAVQSARCVGQAGRARDTQLLPSEKKDGGAALSQRHVTPPPTPPTPRTAPAHHSLPRKCIHKKILLTPPPPSSPAHNDLPLMRLHKSLGHVGVVNRE